MGEENAVTTSDHRNCTCPIKPDHKYTKVLILCSAPASQQLRDLTMLKDSKVGIKTGASVALHFHGKCGMCNHFTKQKVLLSGNNPSQFHTNNYFEAMIKDNIQGIQFCSDTPFNILTLHQTLCKPHNLTPEQFFQKVFSKHGDKNESEEISDVFSSLSNIQKAITISSSNDIPPDFQNAAGEMSTTDNQCSNVNNKNPYAMIAVYGDVEYVCRDNLQDSATHEERYMVISDVANIYGNENERDELIPKDSHTESFFKLPNPSSPKKKHSRVSIDSDENDYSSLIGDVNELNETTCKNEHSIPNELQRSRSPSMDSTGDHCRVCHCRGDEVLIAPCHCNGSLKYVHESCLITWMKNPFKDSCEICKEKILIVKKRKPIYKWRWPLQRPTPLVWVIVFTTAICVNLMSVVKDATRKCESTSCIIFYVIGSVGIILASMFLYFWIKKVKVYCESWKVQNEHWVVKIEDEPGKMV